MCLASRTNKRQAFIAGGTACSLKVKKGGTYHARLLTSPPTSILGVVVGNRNLRCELVFKNG
jgi:hypothetical protein